MQLGIAVQPLSDPTSGSVDPQLSGSRKSLIPGLIVLPDLVNQPYTPCFVIDFSPEACLLQVDVSYTIAQRNVLVRILDSNDDNKLELVGRLTESVPVSIDTATFRCEFGQALPPHVLAMMDQVALADRRVSDRSQCMVRVNVCRIERGQVVTQASMVEASDRGLRLRTEVPLDIGEQIIVQLPSGQDLLVAIVWSKEVNGANQTGGCVTVPSVESSILHSVHRLSE